MVRTHASEPVDKPAAARPWRTLLWLAVGSLLLGTLALRVGSQEARDHIVHTFRQCLFVILESQRELLRARGDHGIQPWSERVRYMNSFV